MAEVLEARYCAPAAVRFQGGSRGGSLGRGAWCEIVIEIKPRGADTCPYRHHANLVFISDSKSRLFCDFRILPAENPCGGVPPPPPLFVFFSCYFFHFEILRRNQKDGITLRTKRANLLARLTSAKATSSSRARLMPLSCRTVAAGLAHPGVTLSFGPFGI